MGAHGRDAHCARRSVAGIGAACSARAAAGGMLGALAIGAMAVAAAAHAKGGVLPPYRRPGPSVAFVTETGSSPATVWLTEDLGRTRTRLGPGAQPLVAPSGQQVAASLFGTGANSNSGPALAIYWTDGRPPIQVLNLATATATPLAWSRDLRYVAVQLQSTSPGNAASGSGLVVVDISLHTVDRVASGQIYGASFAPNGSDQLVYGRSSSLSLSAPVNLYIGRPDGTAQRRLTRDGRSLNPVWGGRGIAYDRERLRRNDAPVYQIWLRSPTGPGIRRLTNIHVRTLASGLVPLAFTGKRLLAEFEGQDTSEAWTLQLPSARLRRLTVRGRSVIGAGLSGDGTQVLVDEGGLNEPASGGRVAVMPFSGGRSTVLVAHGSQASWDGRTR
jgi:hypothetical protein